VAAAQARLWIAQGHLGAAARWASRRGLAQERVNDGPGAGPYALYELERLALAELWMAQDETVRALDLLDVLLAQSRALRRTDTTVKALVLRALAHQQLKHPDGALAALAEALALAQPGGYVRTFVDRGPPMAHLLRQALAQEESVDYVQRLLRSLGDQAAIPPKNHDLVEPLSDRELQVLRFLVTHLSNAEIGEQLFISVNTVRFHVRNIYAKLGVHSRTDAVRRAEELGVL